MDEQPSVPPTDEMAEAALLAPQRVGADAAVVAAYAAYHDELFAFLIRSTRDVEVAEDLLQEAYIRLMRETRSGRTPDQPRAWLYRVCSNLVISRARHGAVVRRVVGRIGVERQADGPETPEGRLLRQERRSELEVALADLPADARLALLLSGQGFSGIEIAAAIGRSNGATRTLLTRARLRVRRDLERREGVA